MVKSKHILTVDAGVTPVVELVAVQEESYFEYVHMYLVPLAWVCVHIVFHTIHQSKSLIWLCYSPMLFLDI